MRQPVSDTRPAVRRGQCAVVLLALLALLHAMFSPRPSHLAALDLDGCRQRAAIARAHACDLATTPVFSGAGAEEHQDGDGASQSCDASAYGPRHLADLSSAHAVTDVTLGAGVDPSASDAASSAALSTTPGTSSGSVVLRC
ncbi:hypothetical protein ACFYTG_39570 [Streptomyces mirabilis]|uniref:hypothetical protein n=1 Tax=Streptomyces mirabilis TaxID=68239 RepID=UPI0036BADE04